MRPGGAGQGFSQRGRLALASGLASLALACGAPEPGAPGAPGAADARLELSSWERGLAVHPASDPGLRMYLWFYEWNLFSALRPRVRSPGRWQRGELSEAGRRGEVALPGVRLVVLEPVAGEADLVLEVENQGEHDWPELASLVPCFNPGPQPTRTAAFDNLQTYFPDASGLRLLAIQQLREIHFARHLQAKIEEALSARRKGERRGGRRKAPDWIGAWPPSTVALEHGLLLRESLDRQWVTGIAWERFLAAQGHNPWSCMHLAVRVGPLEVGASRTIRGKVYLVRGTKEDLLERYLAEFGGR